VTIANENSRAHTRLDDLALPKVAFDGLGGRILNLRPGKRMTLIGIGYEGVVEALKAESIGDRSALLIDTAGRSTTDAIMDQLLDDLADLALERWPLWYGHSGSTQENLIQLAATDRRVSAPWLRAAVKRVGLGRRPRFRRAARALEFVQLMRAVDPSDPILIAAIDPTSPSRAAAVTQVLEWCAAHGTPFVATFSISPPSDAPYDRLLYGAVEVIREVVPARARFIEVGARAHHASAIEQRVEAALRRDPELGPLFLCNETVTVEGFGWHRVDLLWREGGIVVELDGPDHQLDPKFTNDRHRDYELLVAGYLVLRITNDQVETDLQRAVEKIRAVVRYRQLTGKMRP
jgi:very-short-patch-repair endonuclease